MQRIYLNLGYWIALFFFTGTAQSAAAQAHCVYRQPVPDVLTLGVYAEVEEIRTEYYTAHSANGRWAADSLLYTRVACFNSQGFYTHITEFYPDLRILSWQYQYQDGQLVAIVCDRNGYMQDMQTIRWVNDQYYVAYLFPYDARQNMFRLKPESSAGYQLNSAGLPAFSYLAAADSCNKLSETRFVYSQDTIGMSTFDYRTNREIYHTAITVDKDDCGNPLQKIRDRETRPVMEFYRYRYFHR